jgi:uncharacterized membrane protein
VEVLFKQIAEAIAIGVETAAAVLIAYGAIEAVAGSAIAVIKGRSQSGLRKQVWRRFGVWLLLALEFELAADIVRSAIAPTWVDIGQLAAIAVIRTFLNYFLEEDIDKPNEIQKKEVLQAQNRPDFEDKR